MNLSKKERKDKILYLGLDPSRFQFEGDLFHHPIIHIVPRQKIDKIPPCATHIILTSQTSVSLLFGIEQDVKSQVFIAVGSATSRSLKEKKIIAHYVAKKESQEGVIEILETLDLKDAYVYFPHSALSRPIIRDYLLEKKVNFSEVILYDIAKNPDPLPDLSLFTRIIFTSPSTVDAFFSGAPKLPEGMILQAIGPITQKTIDKYI